MGPVDLHHRRHRGARRRRQGGVPWTTRPAPSRKPRRFDGLKLCRPICERKLLLLSLANHARAPNDAKKRSELAEIAVWHGRHVRQGQVLPARLRQGPAMTSKDGCLELDELSRVMAKSRNYDELLDAVDGLARDRAARCARDYAALRRARRTRARRRSASPTWARSGAPATT